MRYVRCVTCLLHVRYMCVLLMCVTCIFMCVCYMCVTCVLHVRYMCVTCVFTCVLQRPQVEDGVNQDCCDVRRGSIGGQLDQDALMVLSILEPSCKVFANKEKFDLDSAYPKAKRVILRDVHRTDRNTHYFRCVGVWEHGSMRAMEVRGCVEVCKHGSAVHVFGHGNMYVCEHGNTCVRAWKYVSMEVWEH